MQTKENLRKEILRKLKKQNKEKRIEKSRAIKEKLFSLKEFKEAEIIFCYISLDREVDTGEIIKGAVGLGKRVFAPVIEGDKLGVSEIVDLEKDLEKGPLGVLQPKETLHSISPEKLKVAIIPGLCFDKKGNRLGRGKAYFDRFLKRLPPTVKTVGLAFDFQILNSILVNSADIPVNIVITNSNEHMTYGAKRHKS